MTAKKKNADFGHAEDPIDDYLFEVFVLGEAVEDFLHGKKSMSKEELSARIEAALNTKVADPLRIKAKTELRIIRTTFKESLLQKESPTLKTDAESRRLASLTRDQFDHRFQRRNFPLRVKEVMEDTHDPVIVEDIFAGDWIAKAIQDPDGKVIVLGASRPDKGFKTDASKLPFNKRRRQEEQKEHFD